MTSRLVMIGSQKHQYRSKMILKCFANRWQKGCKWPSSLPHWNNGAIPRSNFFPFTVLLNPKPVRMISERSIDSILLHFRMESRFLRLADLVVQRMPWGLEELEESSDYNHFGRCCCGHALLIVQASLKWVVLQHKKPSVRNSWPVR